MSEKLEEKTEEIDKRLRKIENMFSIGIGILVILGVSGGYFANQFIMQAEESQILYDKYLIAINDFDEIKKTIDDAKEILSEIEKTKNIAIKDLEVSASEATKESVNKLYSKKMQSLIEIDRKTNKYIFGLDNISKINSEVNNTYYRFDKYGFDINYDINSWTVTKTSKDLYQFMHKDTTEKHILLGIVKIHRYQSDGQFEAFIDSINNTYKSAKITSSGIIVLSNNKIPFNQWNIESETPGFGSESITHYRYYHNAKYAAFIQVIGQKKMFNDNLGGIISLLDGISFNSYQ